MNTQSAPRSLPTRPLATIATLALVAFASFGSACDLNLAPQPGRTHDDDLHLTAPPATTPCNPSSPSPNK